MSSRDDILAALRVAQPEGLPLPDFPAAVDPGRALAGPFSDALRSAAGDVVDGGSEDLWTLVRRRFTVDRVAVAPGMDAPRDAERIDAETPVSRLAEIDTLICRGVLGVSENGAVWLSESRCGHRAAPFLAKHVVVALDRSAIVETMQDAYARIDIDDEDFGVFVAGPSKTADIEQALVIGAHGPIGLLVVLEDAASIG